MGGAAWIVVFMSIPFGWTGTPLERLTAAAIPAASRDACLAMAAKLTVEGNAKAFCFDAVLGLPAEPEILPSQEH